MARISAYEIAEITKDLPDAKKLIFQAQYASERKDPGAVVVLSLFLFDRFYLGDIALGILKLITLGMCGIWGVIDIFTAGSRCDDYNRLKAHEIVESLKLS
jgi:TM2 domain-containing membrane protein YozV